MLAVGVVKIADNLAEVVDPGWDSIAMVASWKGDVRPMAWYAAGG